jgi:predicted nucleic acid-binding protein
VAPEKSRLFDASSLVELIKHGNGAAAVAFSQYTLDLAFYEAGNSFWNDSAAQQLVSREDAIDTVDYLDSVREEMIVLSLSDVGATTVFDTAWDEGVTYYDAAYITAAQETNAMLVTEDGGMADHASEAVSVATAEEILKE